MHTVSAAFNATYLVVHVVLYQAGWSVNLPIYIFINTYCHIVISVILTVNFESLCDALNISPCQPLSFKMAATGYVTT